MCVAVDWQLNLLIGSLAADGLDSFKFTINYYINDIGELTEDWNSVYPMKDNAKNHLLSKYNYIMAPLAFDVVVVIVLFP